MIRHFERVDWRPSQDYPPDPEAWPFNVPAVAQLIAEKGLEIPAGVTILVDENGSGKITLIEALADIYPRTALPVCRHRRVLPRRFSSWAPGAYLRWTASRTWSW